MDKYLRSKISLKNPWHFLGVGFGSGLSNHMPGTFGSLAAIPFLIAFSNLSSVLFIVITFLACAIGVTICQKTSDAMGVHDHGSIVWDEIAGMLVTFIFVPINVWTILAGFVLFRVFDILKPFPIGMLDEKVDGGLGIMVDDVVAGAMACGCLHLGIFALSLS